MVRTCSVLGCTKPYRSRGFCSMHKRAAAARGEVLADYCVVQTVERPKLARGVCPIFKCGHQIRYPLVGLCHRHYHRLYESGTTDAQPTKRERILACGSFGDGCWVWRGPMSTSGYGRIGSAYAHRVSYQSFVGPIPRGYQIDHLCRNKQCVNPDHLEAVTQRENLRRQWLAMREAAS